MVKRDLFLPSFDVDKFMREIYYLQKRGKNSFAELLVSLAYHKIVNTKFTNRKKSYRKQALGIITFQIEMNELQVARYSDIDFDRELEPEEDLPRNHHGKNEIINYVKIKTFDRIEERLVKEGCFFSDGSWLKSTEELVFLVSTLESNGFFRRRSFNGSWFDMKDYIVFFEWRYWFKLSNYFSLEGMDNIESENYLPWIKEYLG